MPISLPFTSRANTDANLFSNAKDNDQAIVDYVNGNLVNADISAAAAISGTKLAAGSVADDRLASPHADVYKMVLQANGRIEGGDAADTYLLGTGLGTGTNADSGSAIESEQAVPAIFSFASSRWDISGKSEKMNIQALVAVNGTAPAANFTFGLHPITMSGSAGLLIYTAGAAVSGSTVAINAPGANDIAFGDGTDFTVPANDQYLLAVATSGATASSSNISVHAQLMIRSV